MVRDGVKCFGLSLAGRWSSTCGDGDSSGIATGKWKFNHLEGSIDG